MRIAILSVGVWNMNVLPDNDNSGGSVNNRRRKLKFRAWHRGMKEMDLILGQFADQRIEQLDDNDLDTFEMLLHVPDQALYQLLVQDAPVPAEIDGELFREIRSFAKNLPRTA